MTKKVEYMEVTPAKLRELLALRERASAGNWEIKRGILRDTLISITTWMRERADSKEGAIAYVHGEHTTYEDRRGEHTSRKHVIKTAQDDAMLITEAVNWLKPMAEALLEGKGLDDTAWLIEFPADKYGPIRYYAAGEPPVINSTDATWFMREKDAKAVLHSEKLTRGYAVEHRWVAVEKVDA